jgi:hypothetical protein
VDQQKEHIMRKTSILVASLLVAAVGAMQAQPLVFTGGTVSNYSNVVLTLHGPTNQVIQVERLKRSNQVWQSVATATLNASGNATVTNALDEGIYGFFRAETTNGVTKSTNAFGAVAGTVAPGYDMIGNPFGGALLTSLLPAPADGTMVYQYTNGNYQIATYVQTNWDQSLFISQGEGVIVLTPTNVVSQRYLVSGLFTTNTISRTVSSGSSILCSPLYGLLVPSAWEVDLLSTNRLGGYSTLPVQSTGNPQSTIYRMVDSAGNYQTFTLAATNVWTTSGMPTTVPLNLTEGFWLNRPTNTTWSFSVPIW